MFPVIHTCRSCHESIIGSEHDDAVQSSTRVWVHKRCLRPAHIARLKKLIASVEASPIHSKWRLALLQKRLSAFEAALKSQQPKGVTA